MERKPFCPLLLGYYWNRLDQLAVRPLREDHLDEGPSEGLRFEVCQSP